MTAPTDDELPPGRLIVVNQELTQRYEFLCDRIAINEGGYLHMLSVVGESAKVKGLRAVLGGKTKHVVYPEDLVFRRPWPAAARTRHSPAFQFLASSFDRYRPLRIADAGFRAHTHRLGYDRVHALFLSKESTFLHDVGEAAIWRALGSNRFTTPMLPHWMPYIIARLAESGRLARSFGQNCRCGTLNATSANLDEIVSRGCRDGAFAVDFLLPETEALAAHDAAGRRQETGRAIA